MREGGTRGRRKLSRNRMKLQSLRRWSKKLRICLCLGVAWGGSLGIRQRSVFSLNQGSCWLPLQLYGVEMGKEASSAATVDVCV